MLTLRAMFALPAKTMSGHDLLTRAFDASWFGEIEALPLHDTCNEEVFKAIEADDRLLVREVAHAYTDPSRHAAIYALWFDDRPFMLVHSGHNRAKPILRRWVGDALIYQEAVLYLRSLMSRRAPTDDTVDMDQPFFVDELCVVGQEDFSQALRLPSDPLLPGIRVMTPRPTPEHVLVQSPSGVSLPEYIRRGALVLRREAPTTHEALVEEFGSVGSLGVTPETVFTWYRPSERPPGTAPIQRV